MAPKLRTTDGYLTVVALGNGEVEQQAWTDDAGTSHITTLSLLRTVPAPPLYRVHHRAFGATMAQSDESYDDIRKARNAFRKLRRSPPTKPMPSPHDPATTEEHPEP